MTTTQQAKTVYRVDGVYLDGRTLVVTGAPYTDEEHNCDVQGCAQHHVILRVPLLTRQADALFKTMLPMVHDAETEGNS